MKKLFLVLVFIFIISVMAFCDDLEIKGTKLVKYTGKDKVVLIPENVKEIDKNAFEKCECLVEIKGSNVSKIDNFAFRGCKNLKKFDFPVLKEVGEESFRDTGLEEISLPKSLKKLRDFAFAECDLLKKANAENVENLGVGIFYSCVALEEVKLNNFLDRVEQMLFFNCPKLTTVNFPKRARKIKKQAFFRCKSLTELEVPVSVDLIEAEAFAYTGLKAITIGNLTRDIAGNAFFGCNKGLIIKCTHGSEAEAFAKAQGYDIQYPIDSNKK